MEVDVAFLFLCFYFIKNWIVVKSGVTPSDVDCNFDQNICNWVQLMDDDFNWRRQKESTTSDNTGPSSDHTTGNGYYIYIETSNPRQSGDNARISSKIIQPTIGSCLRFWYHMYGNNIKRLNLYIKQGTQYGAPAWTKSGDQGDSWHQGSSDVQSEQEFVLVFEGVRGSGTTGDIALDDITYSFWPCDREECDNMFYGYFCNNTCNNCYNGSVCDKMTGDCPEGICDPGWRGFDCNMECDDNSYGLFCYNTCYNCRDGQVCDKVTGDCPDGECKPGWTAYDCNTQCDDYVYGFSCNTTCNNCRDGQVCDKVTGDCPDGECKPGWTAYDCNTQCDDYMYGFSCNTTCNNCRDGQVCDKVIGDCPDGECKPGWTGHDCNTPCHDGSYGYNCSTTCLNCYNNSVCNKVTGHCPGGICNAGWKGTDCNVLCENGTFGISCNDTCGSCLVPHCDRVTGLCVSSGCIEGWTGNRCNIKAEGQTKDGLEGQNANVGALVGAVIGVVVVVVLLVLLSLFIYRRRRKASNKSQQNGIPMDKKKDKNKEEKKGTEPDGYLYANVFDSAETRNMTNIQAYNKQEEAVTSAEDKSGTVYYNTSSEVSAVKNGILLADLWDYVQENCTDTKRLETEFNELPKGLQFPTDEANKPVNNLKNRYKQIYAYDHSRVILQPVGETSDYINACFIKGYGDSKKYIASQGTTKHNVNDFYRMLWQQDCGQIVMLTNLVECSKIKCTQYWPNDGEADYGSIKVTIKKTDVFADYTIRTLLLKSTEEPGTKKIQQFHYTSWPDRDVPGDASSIVQFWSKVKSTKSARSGPMLVHCSAGIGRTGTFIALDYLVDEAHAAGYVNVPNCVETLRRQRVNMIQTQEQYIFLHEALVEALMLSGTATTSDKFPSVYKELDKLDIKMGKTKLQLEFERLQKEIFGRNQKRKMTTQDDDMDRKTLETEHTDFKSAHLPVNLSKNRNGDILAPDLHRPYLSSRGDSDYINAVYLPSHRKRAGYIITQMPLSSTVIDFWRLVHDKTLTTVVMMDGPDVQDIDVGIYWPEQGTMGVGDFQLEKISETEGDNLVTRDIQMKNTFSDVTLKVRQFQCKFWSVKDAVPANLSAIFNVFEAVQDWQRQTTEDIPVLVHCMNGADRSGLYCVLSTILERLNIERDVAVSQTIKKLRLRRQHIIPTFGTEAEASDCDLWPVSDKDCADAVYHCIRIMNNYKQTGI